MSSQEDTKSLYGLSSQEFEKLCLVETAQSDLHCWLKAKKVIGAVEKECLDCKSYDDFAVYWTSLLERTKYAFDHPKGWRKWARKYQSFAAGADHFMKDFSPIVELVQKAGEPYSGLAVGTISVLFIIASNKSRTDDVISSAIAGVKDRLPGFRMYEEIYGGGDKPNQGLGKAILLAYTGFIELAIEATRYYLDPGMSRWWAAASNPGKFQRMASNVQDLVVAVRLQCEELLSWNVSKIREENQGLREQIARLREDSDNQKMDKIQELLDLSTWTLKQRRQELQEYKQSIDRECADDQIFQTMRSGSINQYRREAQHFRKWEDSDKSSMLLLIGANHESVVSLRHHCWMSPLALNLMDKYHSTAGTRASAYAFYAFKLPVQTQIYPVASEILFQLLRWKKHELGGSGDRLAFLFAKLKEYHAIDVNNDDEDTKLEALRHVAATTMQLFAPDETIYLILDRIDRCYRDHRANLLDFLTEIMELAACPVKILAVANSVGWDIRKKDLRRREAQVDQVIERQNLLRDKPGWK